MTNKAHELFMVTEVELIYRNKTLAQERPRIKDSRDAYDIFFQTWDLNKIELLEQFRIILLDRKNSCMGVSTVATGGVSSCVVDPKILFGTAIKARASGIIIAHNHPSGNLDFSQNDKSITKQLAQGGKLLEMPILDHLVVCRKGFSSMADEGLMP